MGQRLHLYQDALGLDLPGRGARLVEPESRGLVGEPLAYGGTDDECATHGLVTRADHA